MLGTSLNSKFILLNSITATDPQATRFGLNINWLAPDLFAVTSNITAPFVTDDIIFSDATYFDGGSTEFGNLYTTASQKIDIFQVLETERAWINSPDDIITTVPVKTIPITGAISTDTTYTGAIENIFISDKNNPQESIKIFNNPSLTHGWTVSTAQQTRVDPNSISRSWIYDSITHIKLADLEVVDLYSGILPGAIASQLDFVSDIDPAVYNILQWTPGTIYAIGDRVLYNGQTYQALYAGKSGSIFNNALWTLLPSTISNFTGITKWGNTQIGRTWFNTAKLKVVNAQLGNLTERAQNWNTWFPNSAIQVFEWVNSSVPPTSYLSNNQNGFILNINCPYTFDPVTQQYGFWVYAKNSLGTIHTQTASQLITSLSNIPNSGIPMITAIDTNAVAVWNVNQFVSSNSVILHVDYVTQSADNQLHNEFALISNDGSKTWYTTPIYPKLVDSLSGVSNTNQLVPDFTLPINQQVGILNNPVQSLFSDRITAIDIYFSVVNQQISNLAIATLPVITALSASDPLPTTGFNEQVPNRAVLNELDPSLFPFNYKILVIEDDNLSPVQWSIVANIDNNWQVAQHQLYNLANNWEYADWYSTNFVSATPTYTLENIGQLSEISYSLGDIIKVNNMGNGNESIFLAVANDINPAVIELDPIFIQNGTIQFLPNLYNFLNSGIGFDNQGFDSQGFDNDPYLAIRLVVQILNSIVFIGSDNLLAAADQSFFAILNYILFENQNLDWLFKTSFVTVDYNNRNLNIQGSYEPDNQSSIEDFVSETLPFHTRVREFRDTYSCDDYGNIGTIDFDLPSQYDANYAAIIEQYTANPKLNFNLPLRAFRKNVGVMLDAKASYITSNGIPAAPTMSSNVQTWTFGFVTVPVTEPIKYDTVPDTAGPIAVAIDGVPFFSPNSGQTETLYLYGGPATPFANININATYTINSVWLSQQKGYDPWAGFTNTQGAYQYLTNPYVMANVAVGTHSPIIGYAWDGNPIYGPYGYANADGSGGIIVNTTSYQLSSVPRLDKTGMPNLNGIQLAQYVAPTGEYIEDFIYIPNSGTLDECNGRFVVTPDHPLGIYAYFATVNSSNVSIPIYPYIIGPCYNSKPFGLQYVYINGINTPVYPNGNVVIPLTPVIDTVNLIRTPDGSVVSDQLTLMNSTYSPWNNNHTYSMGVISVERPGIGYRDLSGNIIITPTNNVTAEVSTLQVVSANIVIGGNNYANGDILSLEGGIFGNAATIQVTNVNVSMGNSITNFELGNTTSQYYTLIPNDIANVSAISVTGNGFGATFEIAFGLETIKVTNTGDNFIFTPSVVVNDANANIAATLYPILSNETTRKMDTTITFDRVSGGQYSGVFVNGGNFIASYPIPTGTIFNTNDSYAGQVSLNISWRPDLLSDTALSTEYSRFGNSSGVFNNASNQYFIVNPAGIENVSDIIFTANMFTIEFFMNFSNLSPSPSVMLDTRANISSSTGIVIFQNNGNLCVGSNTDMPLISSGTVPFTTNNWNFVTIQGCEDILYAYVDGQLIGSANTVNQYTDVNLTLGADVSGANVCTGYMDELRITTLYNRYTPGIINITVPTQEFPRSLATDPYFIANVTPLLWGFENFVSESLTHIIFSPVNSQTLISDLSWNQKKLLLVNYGANLVIDSTTINTLPSPQTSEILAATLNQG